MDPTGRFVALMQVPEPALPLDEAALLIAAHAHPGMDVDAQLARLDELAAGVPAPTLDGLRQHLFRDLAFTGNHDDYYDPRNSFLDDVLDRRTGIPITLSVLMMEVGRRVGVPLAGVSMPGHFLVRDKADLGVFVDPFARGTVLDLHGCEARFKAVHGPDAVLDPSYLEPADRRSIVGRMLANLETVATQLADREMLLWVLGLRVAVPGAGLPERRRLASVLVASGRFREAAAEYERVAAELDDGPVARQAQTAAHRLRARLN